MSFLSELPPHGPARERYVADAIAVGRLDPITWVPVRCGAAILSVSADWLTIDGGRVPMSAPNAQRAADKLGALLPTRKIVLAIEAAARDFGRVVPFVPWPRFQDNSQLETSTILWREENIASHHVPPGVLLAGCLKDVVIARGIPSHPGRVFIFGGLYGDGRRVQGLQDATLHEAAFDNGYAGGIRAVLDACMVNGKPARLSDLYRDPSLSAEVSDEGPLSVVRYPIATVSTAPSGSPRVLRRGMTGPDVRKLQQSLDTAGFSPGRIDDDFGPRTEAALRAFQRARGLDVDGVAGPRTMAALADPGLLPTLLPGSYSLIPARNFTPGRSSVRLIVLHSTEGNGSARQVAQWFAGAAAPKASAHYIVDRKEVVQGVLDSDTAWAAPGANHDGIQIEICGWARWTTAEWNGAGVLPGVIELVRALCERHRIPARMLRAAELIDPLQSGITTHAEVSKAWKRSTHTDPGAGFPLAWLLDQVGDPDTDSDPTPGGS